MDYFDYVHCPNPECNWKLSPDWDVHWVHNDKYGRKVYKCPHCTARWTVDDVQVNSINVTGANYENDFVVIDMDSKEVIGRFSGSTCVQIKDSVYLPLPTKKIQGRKKLYEISPDVEDEDVLERLKIMLEI